MVHISDIKLIRTDTTLDLSQKAEKGMSCSHSRVAFYNKTSCYCFLFSAMWDFLTSSSAISTKSPFLFYSDFVLVLTLDRGFMTQLTHE